MTTEREQSPTVGARDPHLLDVAIIANSHTPYRAHLHRRIVRELPVRLWSVYTHEVSNAPWAFDAAAAEVEEIGPVMLGQGEASSDQDRPGRALHEWRKGGRVIDFIRDRGVRFVVMLGYNDLGRLRVMRWCKRNGVPCYLFGDSNIRADAANRGLKAVVKNLVLRRVVAWCSGTLVCGRLGRAYFEKYGARPERIFLFPVEPDYELIRSLSPETLRRVAEQYNLAPGRRRVVYSGRLAPVKRVDLLLDAFAAVAGERPEWDLLIIGNGPLRDELKSRVPAPLSNRVAWAGFIDDQAAVSAMYRLSDVLVLPSDREPWGLVVNEAVAAGMAVVASDVVGAAAELVRDGANGRLFSAGDLRGLTAALADVTAADRVDNLKSASADVLADWRRRGDPVDGLRAALAASGVLPAHNG